MFLLTKCVVCDAHAHNSYVCTRCEGDFRTLIVRAGVSYDSDETSQACLLDELDVQISRQSRASRRYGGRSAETPLPYDPQASRVHVMLSHVLTHWARHYGVGVVGVGPRVSARWLLNNFQEIILSVSCGPFYTDLIAAVRMGERVIDREVSRRFVGRCGRLRATGYCTANLWAEDGELSVTCSSCGVTHSVDTRRALLLAAAEDTLATATDIAKAVGTLGAYVTASQIWKWKHRGKIAVRALTPSGDPMYRIGDVLALARH